MTVKTRVSSWTPVDLTDWLDEEGIEPEKTFYLGRSDGVPLLYQGFVHVFNGEPGSCKSMAAQAAAVEILRDEETAVHHRSHSPAGAVVYLDFEKSVKAVVRNMRALGASPKQMREGFIYVRPTDGFEGAHQQALWSTINHVPDVIELVVIDGVDDALAVSGFDPNKAADVSRWWNTLVRPLQEKCWGSVLLVDHVPKSKEGRGDYSGGSYRKKAMVDGAQFGFEVVSKFGVGRSGVIRMNLQKDCHGWLEQYVGNGREVAQFRVTSDADTGRISYAFEPPVQADRAAQPGGWRPTGYMQRVSLILEQSPAPLSQNAVVTAAGGKATYVRGALDLLVAEGFGEVTLGPRAAKLYQSKRAYREATDSTSSRPRPDLVRDEVTRPRPTSSPPSTGDEDGDEVTTRELDLVPGTRSPNGRL